jgi:hypothetical protein
LVDWHSQLVEIQKFLEIRRNGKKWEENEGRRLLVAAVEKKVKNVTRKNLSLFTLYKKKKYGKRVIKVPFWRGIKFHWRTAGGKKSSFHPRTAKMVARQKRCCHAVLWSLVVNGPFFGVGSEFQEVEKCWFKFLNFDTKTSSENFVQRFLLLLLHFFETFDRRGIILIHKL